MPTSAARAETPAATATTEAPGPTNAALSGVADALALQVGKEGPSKRRKYVCRIDSKGG